MEDGWKYDSATPPCIQVNSVRAKRLICLVQQLRSANCTLWSVEVKYTSPSTYLCVWCVRVSTPNDSAPFLLDYSPIVLFFFSLPSSAASMFQFTCCHDNQRMPFPSHAVARQLVASSRGFEWLSGTDKGTGAGCRATRPKLGLVRSGRS